MEAPPKLNFFEVAQLLPKLRMYLAKAKKLRLIYPKQSSFRYALSDVSPEHRKYLTRLMGTPLKLDQAIPLVIKEEWIESVLNTLNQYEQNTSGK